MIDLPDYPSPVGATPGLIDFGAFLTPALGGPVQRVERMGNRFKLSVSMPPMNSPTLGRQWVAKLIQGKQEGARMEWPLNGFDPGSPGDIKVAGAGQSGRTLNVDGATPNYPFREGQFFSIEQAGQHFLYMVTTEVLASNTVAGTATLQLEPMLRVSPPDNAVCHFGRPMIEGFILGDSFAWELALAHFVGISFDLVETQ
jgi:hypothetical protein